MIAPAHYLLWLGIAQAAGLPAIAMFGAWFIWLYTPILVKSRADASRVNGCQSNVKLAPFLLNQYVR
jgi:hypothetical protein